MNISYLKLDNPVWHSLNETQRPFSLDFGDLKCYQPDYCPFGGFENSLDNAAQMDKYANIIDEFYIVGDKPEHSSKLFLKRELVCYQMILQDRCEIQNQEFIVPLNKTHRKALFELVNLVQPGYFRSNTADMGDYYGIFKDGILVSVAGERMKMSDFIEVSAIVTHPDHTAKGYAKQLTCHAANRIFEKSGIPYLHVAATNTRAISLYEKLGFKIRRKISFWNFSTKELSNDQKASEH